MSSSAITASTNDAALYRKHVLKEQAPEPVIKIAGLGGQLEALCQAVTVQW